MPPIPSSKPFLKCCRKQKWDSSFTKSPNSDFKILEAGAAYLREERNQDD